MGSVFSGRRRRGGIVRNRRNHLFDITFCLLAIKAGRIAATNVYLPTRKNLKIGDKLVGLDRRTGDGMAYLLLATIPQYRLCQLIFGTFSLVSAVPSHSMSKPASSNACLTE